VKPVRDVLVSGASMLGTMRMVLVVMAPAITCSACDGRLQEPYELPGCAGLSRWKACIVADGHDPKELRITVTPLPPPQKPPTVRPAPELGPNVLLVAAPVRYPMGALFWIHAYPKGSKPADCADVHVGFPFSHESGQ
jgi:hypothetical protein